jgi:hypothetical protein
MHSLAWTAIAPTARVWSFDLAPYEGAIARRAIVDQWLRDRVSAAGGSIWYGADATDHGSGARIELTVRRGAEARTLSPSAVVLATGAGCRVARSAGLHGEPRLGAAVSAYSPTDGDPRPRRSCSAIQIRATRGLSHGREGVERRRLRPLQSRRVGPSGPGDRFPRTMSRREAASSRSGAARGPRRATRPAWSPAATPQDWSTRFPARA